MEQRDYLMRQIEQLIKALSKILSKLLNLKCQGIIDESIGIAILNLNFLLKTNIDEMIFLPEDEFIIFLQEKFNNNPDGLKNFSAILNIIAEDYFKNLSNNQVYLNINNKIVLINNILLLENCKLDYVKK